MSGYVRYANLFEDRCENEEMFETKGSVSTLLKMQDIFLNSSGGLIFLIGQPGSGKTFLLHQIKNRLKHTHTVYLFETPYLTPEDLAGNISKEKIFNPYEAKEKIINLADKHQIILLIDEAQMLNESMLEFIRMLSDSKKLWVVLAMHKKEGKEILQIPHFKSRAPKVLELGYVTKEEASSYIMKKVDGSDFCRNFFSSKNLYDIHKYAKGNFRMIKQICRTILLIVAKAKKIGKPGYNRLNKCIVMMAAIDLGIISE